MTIADETAIEARVALIADVLRLSDRELQDALASWEGTVAFAERHNQSLDWICRGSVREHGSGSRAAEHLIAGDQCCCCGTWAGMTPCG